MPQPCINHHKREGRGFLRQYSLALATFLMDDNKLKSVGIRVQIPAGESAADVATMLYPFRRLRCVPDASMLGNVPSEVADDIVAQMQRIQPALNTVEIYFSVRDEATAYQNLSQVLDAVTNPSDQPFDTLPARINDIVLDLDEAIDEGATAFMSSEGEQEFLKKLGKLQYLMAKVKHADIISAIERYDEAREEALRFEDQTKWVLN